MGIVLELYELKNLCKDMAELGAANYAKMVFPAKDLISQREAYKSFGEARVKRMGTPATCTPYKEWGRETLQNTILQS